MPLTVRDLITAPGSGAPGARRGPDIDGPITWVHVSELRDPTPFLSGGELLLTTGLAFGRRPGSTPAAYVRRLSEAGGGRPGIRGRAEHATVPTDLVAAGARYGLPILEVPRHTPFIAISRAVSTGLAADEYALVAKTFTAQQALTRAALVAGRTGPAGPAAGPAGDLAGWCCSTRPGRRSPLSGEPGRRRRAGRRGRRLAAHRGTVSSGFTLGADRQPAIGRRRPARPGVSRGRPAGASCRATDRHLVNAAVMLLTIRLEQSPGARPDSARCGPPAAPGAGRTDRTGPTDRRATVGGTARRAGDRAGGHRRRHRRSPF